MPAYCEPVTVEQCCQDCEPYDDAVWDAAVEVAWTKLVDLIADPTLWEWRRCLRVWRPCPTPCGCRSYCACGASRVVTVPQVDVRPGDVAALLVDDVVDTDGDWMTARGATETRLTLLGHRSPMPLVQNMDERNGQPSTWGVALWVGRTPPVVLEAVGSIACEWLARCSPTSAPPANATSITEGSVTMVLDPHSEAVRSVRDALRMTTQPAFEFAAPWDEGPAGRWEDPAQAAIDAVVSP